MLGDEVGRLSSLRFSTALDHDDAHDDAHEDDHDEHSDHSDHDDHDDHDDNNDDARDARSLSGATCSRDGADKRVS